MGWAAARSYQETGVQGGHMPPKIWEKIFFGQLLCKIRAFFRAKNHVKFGHSGNFSYIFFFGGGAKMSCPLKLTGFLRLKTGLKLNAYLPRWPDSLAEFLALNYRVHTWSIVEYYCIWHHMLTVESRWHCIVTIPGRIQTVSSNVTFTPITSSLSYTNCKAYSQFSQCNVMV